MGCNESKHDVATGNTVSNRPLLRRKSTTKNKENQSVNPSTADSSLEKTGGEKVVVGNDVKDIAVSTELKEGDKTEPGKSLLSPDHYFSSRNDDDAAESVATEEGYFSPPHEPVTDVEDEVAAAQVLKEKEEKVDDEVKEKEKSLVEQKEEEITEKLEGLKIPNSIEEEVNAIAPEVVTTTEEIKLVVLPQEKHSDTTQTDAKDPLK